MNNLRTPNIDSATGKGLMTILQAFITFFIGLTMAIWSVPGVPKAIVDFVWNNGPSLLVTVGLPLAVGSGVVSFILNRLFRKGTVSAY